MNELIKTTNANEKKLLKEAMDEIKLEVKDANKEQIKRKIKQIRMAELTLEKLREDLKELLQGKRVSEEEYLFGE